MRYIRFLKTPRVIPEKGTSKSQISCLITITSDLGDSFLPYDVQLSAELLSSPSPETVLIWRTVQWNTGMRSLPITFPLTRSYASSTLRVRVGFDPKSTYDEFGRLSEKGSCGVVAAWSSELTLSTAAGEAERLVERRFAIPKGHIVSILEETGESIARHLWDAGIVLSHLIDDLLKDNSPLVEGVLSKKNDTRLQVLELGTGCGIVGITIAQTTENAEVLLTDLPEAQDIVERNTSRARPAKGSSLTFQELDWDAELPPNLQSSSFDLVLAADCTYNPDSSPALVDTLTRVANISPKVRVAIAMKMRHSSEQVFFNLMARAGFKELAKLEYPLPGDTQVGEEVVYLHVYQYKP